MGKKTKVVFSTPDGFVDTHLRATKPSKTDTIIACIKSTSLIKAQVRIENASLPLSNTALSDWLYAKCVAEGIFEPNISYCFVYLCQDFASEKVFQIYALDLAYFPAHQILIPDIFLPMGLDLTKHTQSVFLFDKNLVFYHQNELVYHSFCQNPQEINKALDYIHAIYSIAPSVIYAQDSETLELISSDVSLPILPLSALTGESENPIATLAFLYFSKSQNNALPLLFPSTPISFYQSKTFDLLVKTLCATLLMLLYPTSEFLYSIYLKHRFEALTKENLATLQTIATYSQSTAPEKNKAQDTALQDHLYALYQAQIAYLPRYNLLADLSKMLAFKDIVVEDIRLTSDIFQDVAAMSFVLSSLSQKNIINAINALQNSPHWTNAKQQIFFEAISKNQEKSSAEIIWVRNVF
ncbi:hypothetical protein [Helicobacter sp. 11S02596-1]|uniref:hypothetical protein n=1 Tax=Helicobacter sp. 11S02596-1 TaxID=1476194 RepID=UPI00117BB24D|nr:hypothetical protein [Helicobacter sp. 11S02596-1]